MAFFTQADADRLGNTRKVADDNGAAWNLPRHLGLNEQLLFVLHDPEVHHIGWSEYQQDLVRRLIAQGADPFALQAYAHLPTRPLQGAAPRGHAVSWHGFGAPVARMSLLGYAIGRGNMTLTALLLTAWANENALPPALELADGRVVDALEFAALGNMDAMTAAILARFPAGTLGSGRAAHLADIAHRVYALQEANAVVPNVNCGIVTIINALVHAGARLDPARCNRWTFKDGRSTVGLAGACVASVCDTQGDRSAVYASGPGAPTLNWAAEMARRSVLVAARLERLAAQGIDVVGDTGKRCTSILHRAADGGLVSCVDLLLRLGAAPGQRDSQGRTPADLPKVEPSITLMLQAASARHAMDQVLEGEKPRTGRVPRRPRTPV